MGAPGDGQPKGFSRNAHRSNAISDNLTDSAADNVTDWFPDTVADWVTD
jgi:hypothetical protein